MQGDASQSPQMFSSYIYKWLDSALDYGITEHDFWNMTIAELERAINSKKRMEKIRAQERASFDYILSDLIGKSISRIYSSSNSMPAIEEVYSSLFDDDAIEEQKQEKITELSALRFKQFANAYNKNFNEGGADS